VANSRNNGNGTTSNCPHHDFFIERPQVFHGTASASDKQNIGRLILTKPFNGTRNGQRCPLALDGYGVDE
jgi:hypothetical protein